MVASFAIGVSALKCIGPDRTDLRAEAALSLLRAAQPPVPLEISTLASEVAATWGSGPLGVELIEAARLLRLGEIVARYNVRNFHVMDPAHANRLVEFILTQVDTDGASASANASANASASGRSALDDALQVCNAYSHLDASAACSTYLMNAILLGAPTAAQVKVVLDKLPLRDAAMVTDKVLHFCLCTLDDVETDLAALPTTGSNNGDGGAAAEAEARLELEKEACVASISAINVASCWHTSSVTNGTSSNGSTHGLGATSLGAAASAPGATATSANSTTSADIRDATSAPFLLVTNGGSTAGAGEGLGPLLMEIRRLRALQVSHPSSIRLDR